MNVVLGRWLGIELQFLIPKKRTVIDMNLIPLKSNVRLGVVPTHLKFVGGLVPDETGKVPRDAEGVLIVVDNMRKLTEASRVKISCVQIPYFPGLDEEDVAEMVREFRALDLEVQFILMVGGADPMNPDDEDADSLAELFTVGGTVWPCAAAMCRWLADNGDEAVHGKSVLELGSGTGACGLFAAASGAAAIDVTLTKICYMGNWSILRRAVHDYIDPTCPSSDAGRRYFGWLLPK